MQQDDAADLACRTAAAFAPDGPLAKAFPGFRARPQQTELAELVAQAFASDGTAVAEAGTGVGKTFAYLVPALLAGGKVLVSTGTRTLQDQLFGRDLPTIAGALGRQASTALLKGRANYVCRYHLHRNLDDARAARREVASTLQRIQWFAGTSESGDRAACAGVPEDADAWVLATSTRDNCLGQECPDWSDCFVVRARRNAQAAEIVVVNHHLFCADLALRDEGVSDLLPSANAIVFDEAHLLPDICSQFFGVGVSTRQLVDLARDAVSVGLAAARDAGDWPMLSDALVQAARALRSAWPNPSPRADADVLLADRDFARGLAGLDESLHGLCRLLGSAATRDADLARICARGEALLGRLRAWAGPAAPGDDGGAALDGLGDLGERHDADGTPDALDDPLEPPVRWGEAHPQAITLHRTPVSVAEPFTRQRHATRCAWVFVSATLALGGDFGHFRRALGLDDATCRRWDSPFDFARQALLYVPEGCGEPQSAGFTDAVIERAWPLLAANRGRAFVLCTSLRAVRRAAEVLRARLPETMLLLVQGEAPRGELLQRFRDAPAPVLVGAASFWQGIDVRGDQLSLVIIDKLPFAAPDDPVLQARIRAMRDAGRDPFVELQLPAAAVALKQGAGRLIRSEGDRGLLMIGDARLVGKGYGKRLLASLPPFPVTRDQARAVAFIQGGPVLPA